MKSSMDDRGTFVDTSGFFSLLVKPDEQHTRAFAFLNEAQEKKHDFFTTDYVLDETATLLKARGHGHQLDAFFKAIVGSRACHVEWTDASLFWETVRFFLKRADQRWSFTDCLSFCVMDKLKLRNALTKDVHFEQAGFLALLR